MKNKTILFFLLLLFYIIGYSQNNKIQLDSKTLQKELNFEIVFGVYNDDQYNHTFDAKERKWILKNGILIYKIDAYDVSYVDTLTLKETDIKIIIDSVKEYNLFSSINKDLSKDYLNKYGHTESIQGQLNYNNQKANFNIRMNSSSSFDEDADAKRLKKFEDLLYQIIETYKK